MVLFLILVDYYVKWYKDIYNNTSSVFRNLSYHYLLNFHKYHLQQTFQQLPGPSVIVIDLKQRNGLGSKNRTFEASF